MFSPPDLGVLAAAFHPNGLSNAAGNAVVNARFPQSVNSDDNNGNNFNSGFCSRQSAFSSPEKGVLSPRQNSYVGVNGKMSSFLKSLHFIYKIHYISISI